jgi:hypothetical protein
MLTGMKARTVRLQTAIMELILLRMGIDPSSSVVVLAKAVRPGCRPPCSPRGVQWYVINGAKVQVISQARTTAFRIFLSDLDPANSSFY